MKLIPLQIDNEIVPQTKTTMPVQRLKEPQHTAYTSEDAEDKFVRPKTSGKPTEHNDKQKQNISYNEVYSNNFISNPVILETNNPPPPIIPERTSASNLNQFKEYTDAPDNHAILQKQKRVSSPSSSGLGPNRNYGLMRKTSYQSERVVPNDDLALSRARAAGARNFSPRVRFKNIYKTTL